MTVQSNNLGRTVPSAKHDDDTAVLIYVRGSLSTAASIILVSHLHWPENAEGLAALGRRVDVAARRKRCCRDEENSLPGNPGCELGIDVVLLLTHGVKVGKVEPGAMDCKCGYDGAVKCHERFERGSNTCSGRDTWRTNSNSFMRPEFNLNVSPKQSCFGEREPTSENIEKHRDHINQTPFPDSFAKV
jgi:hypothetical protein